MMRPVKCERCGVTVLPEALDTPNRCLDWRCPTMSYEARLKRAKELGLVADFYTWQDNKRIERMAQELARTSK